LSVEKESSNKSFYTTTDEQSGRFLLKKITRTVSFTANDFDEFLDSFRRLTYDLGIWQDYYGRKAAFLQLNIAAHPWILKRIKEHLSHAFPEVHPYGRFTHKHAVTIHLHDPLDPIGEHLVLSQGKLSRKRTPELHPTA
jgi:hypothetical protein